MVFFVLVDCLESMSNRFVVHDMLEAVVAVHAAVPSFDVEECWHCSTHQFVVKMEQSTQSTRAWRKSIKS
uniref:Uncharacterized protein n=1 Tax=Globodera rostochiensis TaxID=31243 RepID=A0A914IA10_GLORO